MYIVYLLKFYKSYNDTSKYYLLLTHTYAIFVKQSWGLVYRSMLYIKFYQVRTYFSIQIKF